ncbi:MAG: WGR domain-containing protein [Alphaproteobacteria bacterium]|jgi:predicted DNA-binding WGR domain protein|nr:WGR domain-containing protein [Alphaproteobacteria bacterium]
MFPVTRFWLSANRYYSATVTTDLLGDLVLVRRWGGRFNARGGEAIALLADRAAGEQALRDLDRRRTRRGYRAIAETPNVGVEVR